MSAVVVVVQFICHYTQSDPYIIILSIASIYTLPSVVNISRAVRNKFCKGVTLAFSI